MPDATRCGGVVMRPEKRVGGVALSVTERPPRRWLPRAMLGAVGLVAVVAFVAVAWLRGGGQLGPEPTAVQAGASSDGRESAIVVTPPRLDAGDVFMNVSEVPMRFEVTNTGERVAVITYLETSCDCTKATIVVDGREGPRFAMRHDTPPGTYDWRAVLAPGETVVMMVY